MFQLQSGRQIKVVRAQRVGIAMLAIATAVLSGGTAVKILAYAPAPAIASSAGSSAVGIERHPSDFGTMPEVAPHGVTVSTIVGAAAVVRACNVQDFGTQVAPCSADGYRVPSWAYNVADFGTPPPWRG
jgi:hypothetical protein